MSTPSSSALLSMRLKGRSRRGWKQSKSGVDHRVEAVASCEANVVSAWPWGPGGNRDRKAHQLGLDVASACARLAQV